MGGIDMEEMEVLEKSIIEKTLNILGYAGIVLGSALLFFGIIKYATSGSGFYSIETREIALEMLATSVAVLLSSIPLFAACKILEYLRIIASKK